MREGHAVSWICRGLEGIGLCVGGHLGDYRRLINLHHTTITEHTGRNSSGQSLSL